MERLSSWQRDLVSSRSTGHDRGAEVIAADHREFTSQ
jgi:hypothetical protein